jgi:hypothetical protein
MVAVLLVAEADARRKGWIVKRGSQKSWSGPSLRVQKCKNGQNGAESNCSAAGKQGELKSLLDETRSTWLRSASCILQGKYPPLSLPCRRRRQLQVRSQPQEGDSNQIAPLFVHFSNVWAAYTRAGSPSRRRVGSSPSTAHRARRPTRRLASSDFRGERLGSRAFRATQNAGAVWQLVP